MSTITHSAVRPVRVRPVRVRTVRPVPVRPVRAAAPGWRLTRRGRLVLSALTLALLVVTAVLASGGGLARAGSPGGTPEPTLTRVTVAPGETLWALADRVAPDRDPRAVIAEIMEVNAMTSAGVQAGQVLLLPRG